MRPSDFVGLVHVLQRLSRRADSFAGTSTTISPSATRRCARCRPHPGSPRPPIAAAELPARGQHQPVAVAVGAEPARHQRLFVLVEHLDRRRPLVRVHPDHDPAHQHPPSPRRTCDRRRRAALSRASQTPGATPRHGARRDARHVRATSTPPRAADVGATPPDTSPQPGQTETSVESEIAAVRAPLSAVRMSLVVARRTMRITGTTPSRWGTPSASASCPGVRAAPVGRVRGAVRRCR
jgi:hypothetical protein